MKGRKPKAPHLRLIQGNAGHRAKDTRVSLEVPVEVGRPPRWLTKAARKEWRTIVPALKEAGILARLDTAQIAMWCTCVARLEQAETHLNAEGTMITTPTGFQRPSPWFKVSTNLNAQMMRLAAEYGMTPASRARLKIEAPREKDAFELYLESGRDRAPQTNYKSPHNTKKARKAAPPDNDDDDDDTLPPAA